MDNQVSLNEVYELLVKIRIDQLRDNIKNSTSLHTGPAAIEEIKQLKYNLSKIRQPISLIDKSQLFKLQYRNNWEVDEYYITDNNTKIKVDKLKYIVIDDNPTAYEVTSEIVSVPYSDHGHTYEGTSKHYFVNLPAGKSFVKTDINSLVNKCNVYMVKDKDING